MSIPPVTSTPLSSNRLAPDGDTAATEARETAVAKRAEAQNGGLAPKPESTPPTPGRLSIST